MLSYAEKETPSTPCVLCTAFRCDVATYGDDEPREKLAGGLGAQENGDIQSLVGILDQLDDQDLHNLREVYLESPLQFEVMAMLLNKYTGGRDPVTLQIVGFNPRAEEGLDSVAAESGRAMLSSFSAVERMRSWFVEPNGTADGRVNEYVEASLVPSRDGQLELTISSWPTSYIEQNDRTASPRLRSVVVAAPAVSGQGLDLTVQDLSITAEK